MSSDKLTSGTRTHGISPSLDVDLDALQVRYDKAGFRLSLVPFVQKVKRFLNSRRQIVRGSKKDSNMMRWPRLDFTKEGHLVIIQEDRLLDRMDEEEMKYLRNGRLIVTKEGRLVFVIEEDHIDDWMKERESNNLRCGHFTLMKRGSLGIECIDEDRLEDWMDEAESNNPRFEQPIVTDKGLIVIMEKDQMEGRMDEEKSNKIR
ncbi:hypothetical protein MMC07_004315 [Pseudocyphellaria aurata]|nr:hypothetical protein [Pseudocyphellaria aurata]